MFFLFAPAVLSLMPVPKRYPGLRWGTNNPIITVELFADPLCPDCQAIWPRIQYILNTYSQQINVIVHMLPLPYHTWAFVITRSILACNSLNEGTGNKFLELLYAGDIDQFQNDPMKGFGERDVLELVSKYVQEKLLINTQTFLTEYNKADISMAARIEFKFAASHSVSGTPTVYVNGVETELNAEQTQEEWDNYFKALL
ncbi:DSBA-like thioredoxin domain containing protein [Histomonas meleagridis]|uniref:DSBA-like thioredoxin domain containing protein n=1 Tax=Histomonas meleagridis TaxID=135588 RepID=UPI00355A0585|nr:DSBA-like thioredoxin domain containing protein [Histomonas meleagridis]KAH0797179.1 DSBA-like thioredoxin domain containing protein [Histomonas meleagridis]